MGYPVLISISRAIEENKKSYYQQLENAQKSNEISQWVSYFIDTLLEAQKYTEDEILFTLKKTKFFDKFKSRLNERQVKVLSRMFKEGSKGFEGGMSAKKYMAIVSTSKATATRDLKQLVDLEVFIPVGAGRSLRYEIYSMG